MKLQIRGSVFETNSSSTHSITLCTEKDFNDWEKGLKFYDSWEEKLVAREDININDDKDEDRYLGYDEYWERYEEYYEGFEERYTSPSGDKIIAFGYYGYDG